MIKFKSSFDKTGVPVSITQVLVAPANTARRDGLYICHHLRWHRDRLVTAHLCRTWGKCGHGETYHVVSGKVMSSDIAGKMMSTKTVEGSEVKIDASSGVKINDATVTQADITADNGVIHVIDTVIMPKG